VKSSYHIPALATEVVKFLQIKDGGIYIDATVGTGGHTEAILRAKKDIFLYCLDIDGESLKIARKRLHSFKNSVKFIHANFSQLDRIGIAKKVDGVLFDLGMSSFQLDDEERGFSYKKNGPLDMRMGRESGAPLRDIIKNLTRTDIEKIIKEYGEERYFKRIAREIAYAKKMNTTEDLKMAILSAGIHKYREKSLSRVFQAFRIFINDELRNLQKGLEHALSMLKPEGRICCISYHSLEDRIVKNYFRKEKELRILTKRPITPSPEELLRNRRVRSAKLRVVERI
jgi:16S rRNA (cytosine1402-N4)-methyltransferase